VGWIETGRKEWGFLYNFKFGTRKILVLKNYIIKSQLWWYTPVIPALRRLKQEDYKFKASLGLTLRSYLKKKKPIYYINVYI
jgi:hypothetical protein